MKNSIFVYGPSGCGKSFNAKRIAKAYGLAKVHDDYRAGDAIPAKDTLILAINPPALWPHDVRLVHFNDAMTYARRFGT